MSDYLAETLVENRLDAFLKPVVGKLSDRDRPGYQTEDTFAPGRRLAFSCGCLLWLERLHLDLQVLDIVLLSPDSSLQLFNH